MRAQTVNVIWTVCMLIVLVSSSSGVSDTEDDFVYVAALEKSYPDEPCTMWDPTLYRISVQDGEIAKQVKIADQGSVISCEPLGEDSVRVILNEGIFANGTKPGEMLTIEIIVDKQNLAILERNTTPGIDLKKSPIHELRERLKTKREVPAEVVSRAREVGIFLAASPKSSRVFVLSHYSKKRELSVKVLDSGSLDEIESIPLNVADRKIGGFASDFNTALLKDRFLICLFSGDSPIGHFAPGYVAVVDMLSRSIKYVAIGSDPAIGIAYYGLRE